MTVADDAFDKLMSKNALVIPVATPSPKGDTDVRDMRTATRVRSAQPSSGTAIKVNTIQDAAPDYHPAGDDEDSGSEYTTPTETDMDAVADLDAAQDLGVRVMGVSDTDEFRDSDEAGDAADDSGFVDVREVADNVSDSEKESGKPPAPPALERARTVRRFSYLPLAGMEAFESRARDIMANLVSQEPEKPSLAIASPARGCGQTEIAIRLALAAAKRVDYRVLLVDFDVRRPQIAARLGLSSKFFTVSDVLRGACPLGDALVFSEEDNLYVLPARASDRDGDEILNDRQVRVVMEQLHQVFDFVILGCGPLDHADAFILCRHAGQTALAGYCGRSRAGAIAEAAERLADSGLTLAGLLLTGSS